MFSFKKSPFVQYVQGSVLGCVNSPPAASGSQEAGFKQPRDHSFAQPCSARPVLLHFKGVARALSVPFPHGRPRCDVLTVSGVGSGPKVT